ncbi:hypothetical protein L873DRAFT_1297737 [Choiromyces venosus 120613-1]|uniref:Uncharacterized protein n=1 Tax=Choiromyces venosus 120613-1 TaxID=1336337 RepID=A0A3N4JP97_9PEZI|nr:hypothetical protein L873DRAFT_1297737 [Choiromyces venosus 120613-1]
MSISAIWIEFCKATECRKRSESRTNNVLMLKDYGRTFRDMIVVLMESSREWESLLRLSFVLVDFGESSPSYFSLLCFGMLWKKMDICGEREMVFGFVL